MDIKPFTPAIRMQRTALIRRSVEWHEDLAKTYGVTDSEVYLALLDFLGMSLRVENVNGALDFKLAAPTDTAEHLRKKFTAYLETQNSQAVWNIEAAIREYDTPIDEDLAPGVTSEDPE